MARLLADRGWKKTSDEGLSQEVREVPHQVITMPLTRAAAADLTQGSMLDEVRYIERVQCTDKHTG